MAIVGRDGLVAGLREQLAGRMVLVTGEAGAGKTEVARAVVGETALWGFCEPLDTPRPLGPFRDIARQLPGTPELADPVAAGEAMLAAKAVLVVEDAHWIDAASADTLRFLGRRLGPSAAGILVTYRDELAPDHPLRAVLGDLATSRGVVRTEVPPLTKDEVAELTRESTVDPAEAYELTGGNAFLVSQLAAGGVTMTVRDSVAARLRRLPDPTRQEVELLSVMPGRSHAPDGDLDPAVRAGLLRVDGAVVEFRHELVRRAVEQELGPGRRRELHAEVLRRLPADADPATVAFHARGAHDPGRVLAAERAAGDQASVLGSHREAVAHYRNAVVHGAALPPADRARLEIALSREEYWTGHDRAAQDAARRAVGLVPDGDLPLRATALRWLGRLSPRQEESHRLTVAAVRVAEEIGPSPALVEAYAGLANERMIGRDLVAAADWARRALELATGGTEALTTALQALGAALLLGGDPAGEEPLRRAIEVAGRAGIDAEVGRAYTNLFSAAGEGKLYAVADAVVGEALGYFVSRDLDAHGRYTRAWHARCRFEQGRWDEALAEAERALTAPSAITIAVLVGRYVRGRIAVRRGEAPPALDESLDIATATGSLQRIAPYEALLAEQAWLAGTPPGDGLRTTYDLAVELANPWSAGELGFWLWRHGSLEKLPDVAAEPYRLHAAGDPLGAGRAWERVGCPYEAADAYADTDDEEAVRKALATFTRLGAVPGRQRAARRLRELGVRTIPRGPSPAAAHDPDGLTAREQEVLGWLRDGRTDAEIAAGLHLSVRTVGHHVSAVLRKTGVRSRRELRR